MYADLNLHMYLQATEPTEIAETARKIDTLIGQREALIVSLPDDHRISAAPDASRSLGRW